MRIRAFVFDDDPLVRSILWSVLERRGYEVFTFPDPVSCPLHTAGICRCPADQACGDIIISDLEMPGVRGLEFIQSQQAKGCKCPHIALISGNWSEPDLRRAADLGCKTFAKPFDISEIRAWLDECETRIDPGRTVTNWFLELAGEERR